MKSPKIRWWIAALAAHALGYGYVRLVSSIGVPLIRTDASSIQYLVHSSMQAGAVNADGAVVLTPLSDPMGALSAATASWTAVPSSTVRFAPLKPTTNPGTSSDNAYTITIEDTPQHRSAVGSALAVTLSFYNPANGQVSDADIIFNPHIVDNGAVVPFSTDRSPSTYDLQTVAVHEMGHALGAAHSGVIAATMYPYTGAFSPAATTAEATNSSTLSADDIAFVTTAYPTPEAASQFGKITGTVTMGGAGVVGALVTAVDVEQGIAVGGLVTAASGAYAITMLPPGNYQVFAHPLDGPVTRGNFGSNQFGGLPVVDSFQAAFSGGNAAPAAVAVTAGGAAEANIAVPSSASGLHIDFLGTGGVAGHDFGLGGVRSLTGGQSRMVYLWGKGLDGSIQQNNIRMLGPAATLRAGSLQTDPSFQVNGLTPIRFIVDVAGTGVRTPIPLAVVKDDDATVDDGTLVLLPDGGPPSASSLGVVHAASFEGGAVSPGEVVTVFGKQFGPPGATVVLAAIDPSGKLSTSRSDTRVLFDGRPSPIIYVVNNAVSAVVPWEVAGQKSTSMTVEYNGAASAPVNLAVAEAGPAFFTACSCGFGQIAALNPDGSYNSADNPAPAGSTLVMYWTGGGLLNPAAGTGDIIQGLLYPSVTPTVSIGGVLAKLDYWGAAPTFVAGLMQLNVTIPAGVASGPAVPLVLTTGDFSSRPGVTIAVK